MRRFWNWLCRCKGNDIEFRINVVKVKDDDVIVLSTKQTLTVDQVSHLRAMIQDKLPNLRTLVLTNDLKLAILRDGRLELE